MAVALVVHVSASIDTSVRYLGLRLRHPFIVGASPLSANLDTVRRLEDAGAAAIVLPSLFEEQITEARTGRIGEMDPVDPQFSALLLAYPNFADYAFTPRAHPARESSDRRPSDRIAQRDDEWRVVEMGRTDSERRRRRVGIELL